MVYSNSCCSCSFEPEIIKIGQSSHKMYSNSILNFQESMTIFNACTKKVFKLFEGTSYLSLCIFVLTFFYRLTGVRYLPASLQAKYGTWPIYVGSPARTETHAGLAQKLRGSHYVPLTGLPGTRAVFNYS